MKPLTHRQATATALLAQGNSCKGIAQQMGVTLATAQTMIAQARARIGAKTAAHLVAIAIQQKFIQLVCVMAITSMLVPQDDAMRRGSVRRPVRRIESTAIVI